MKCFNSVALCIFLYCYGLSCFAPERGLFFLDGNYRARQTKYLNQGMIETVTFNSAHNYEQQEEIMRSGILVRRPNAEGTILLCHGFMCDKYDTGFLRTFFPTFNVLIFDFRAHGDHITEHHCCTFGRDEAHDVIAAARYSRNRTDLQLDKKPLIVYGFSMGAVASIQAQALEGDLFDAMILDCPYDTSENVIKRCMENLKFSFFGYKFSLPGKTLLEKYAFNPYVQSILKTLLKTVANLDATATNTYIYPVSPAESIKKIKVPCLLIHCVNDEKVAVDAARTLFINAGGYKRLWLTAGRRHFDSFFYNPEKYIYKVNKFIHDVMSNAIKHKKPAKIHTDSEYA